MRFFYAALVFFLILNFSFAQEKTEKEKLSMKVFKDSLDGKLDMSDFLINYHGFIPLANIITEPALGGIGVMVTPIFIEPNKYQEAGKYTPPNITAGGVGYSGNKSWGVGAMRIASLPKHHLKYRVGGGYGDVNMDFFRDFPVIGERQFAFNFNTTALFGNVLRQVGQSDLYLGVMYLYLHNKVKPQFGEVQLPDFVDNKALDNNLSSVGVNLQYDKRDNVFTPNKGLYVTSSFRVNAGWTGSDYDYRNWMVSALQYLQLTDKWVSGFRFEGNLQFGHAPFYFEPGVSLRGVPAARYQGDQTYLLETEQRYDLTQRWSLIGFVGAAKALPDKVSFSDADLVYNYGTGFRYLIARKFGVRTGIDVAWSNEDFGWYIVFGSAWNNRN
ncbi:BamA/TamA family outer membrane protein [Algoriphagus resistens]|uniref:BamA/TamA family outer membrane protein n=1 Tax=Algoriphagus resistens TaxID=1750590 RepID=UPI0007167FD5|nr:BamA/TamA family outer membrane protein [Algoriphagus resistens]